MKCLSCCVGDVGSGEVVGDELMDAILKRVPSRFIYTVRAFSCLGIQPYSGTVLNLASTLGELPIFAGKPQLPIFAGVEAHA
jgi:hypothetical protein